MAECGYAESAEQREDCAADSATGSAGATAEAEEIAPASTNLSETGECKSAKEEMAAEEVTGTLPLAPHVGGTEEKRSSPEAVAEAQAAEEVQQNTNQPPVSLGDEGHSGESGETHAEEQPSNQEVQRVASKGVAEEERETPPAPPPDEKGTETHEQKVRFLYSPLELLALRLCATRGVSRDSEKTAQTHGKCTDTAKGDGDSLKRQCVQEESLNEERMQETAASDAARDGGDGVAESPPADATAKEKGLSGGANLKNKGANSPSLASGSFGGHSGTGSEECVATAATGELLADPYKGVSAPSPAGDGVSSGESSASLRFGDDPSRRGPPSKSAPHAQQPFAQDDVMRFFVKDSARLSGSPLQSFSPEFETPPQATPSPETETTPEWAEDSLAGTEGRSAALHGGSFGGDGLAVFALGDIREAERAVKGGMSLQEYLKSLANPQLAGAAAERASAFAQNSAEKGTSKASPESGSAEGVSKTRGSQTKKAAAHKTDCKVAAATSQPQPAPVAAPRAAGPLHFAFSRSGSGSFDSSANETPGGTTAVVGLGGVALEHGVEEEFCFFDESAGLSGDVGGRHSCGESLLLSAAGGGGASATLSADLSLVGAGSFAAPVANLSLGGDTQDVAAKAAAAAKAVGNRDPQAASVAAWFTTLLNAGTSTSNSNSPSVSTPPTPNLLSPEKAGRSEKTSPTKQTLHQQHQRRATAATGAAKGDPTDKTEKRRSSASASAGSRSMGLHWQEEALLSPQSGGSSKSGSRRALPRRDEGSAAEGGRHAFPAASGTAASSSTCLHSSVQLLFEHHRRRQEAMRSSSSRDTAALPQQQQAQPKTTGAAAVEGGGKLTARPAAAGAGASARGREAGRQLLSLIGVLPKSEKEGAPPQERDVRVGGGRGTEDSSSRREEESPRSKTAPLPKSLSSEPRSSGEEQLQHSPPKSQRLQRQPPGSGSSSSENKGQLSLSE